MLRADQTMRSELGRTTLADLAKSVARKAPASFGGEIRDWLAGRATARAERAPRRRSRRA
jgi:hypothetical protein